MIAVAKVGDLGQRAVAIYHPVGEAIALFDRDGVLVYNSHESRDLFHDWRHKDPLLASALDSGETQLGRHHPHEMNKGCTEHSLPLRVPMQDVGWVAGGPSVGGEGDGRG